MIAVWVSTSQSCWWGLSKAFRAVPAIRRVVMTGNYRMIPLLTNQSHFYFRVCVCVCVCVCLSLSVYWVPHQYIQECFPLKSSFCSWNVVNPFKSLQRLARKLGLVGFKEQGSVTGPYWCNSRSVSQVKINLVWNRSGVLYFKTAFKKFETQTFESKYTYITQTKVWKNNCLLTPFHFIENMLIGIH